MTKTTTKIYGKFSLIALLPIVYSSQAWSNDEVSPARKISRDPSIPVVRDINSVPPPPPVAPDASEPEHRTIDGTNNNLDDPLMGAAGIRLTRMASPTYADGISTMAGTGLANPRDISNLFGELSDEQPSSGPTDFVWQWGQFLDHDISISEGVFPAESTPIVIPDGDEMFDPFNTGTQTMAFNRTVYDKTTGTSTTNPRQQVNEITAWIDASNVYGSEEERADYLRTNDGTGRLKKSSGNFLPRNVPGFPNAGGESDQLFLAGDVRANEQVGLLSLHTLFMREHNRLVKVFHAEFPELDGDQLYEKARKVVGAQMQYITYKEYLPTLLGPRAISPYRRYKPDVDARLSNEFTSALYRYGHSLVSPQLLRIDKNGSESGFGHLPLREAFFAPHKLGEAGIEPILRGLAHQPARELDLKIVPDIRNFLFGPPGAGGFDLMSLNIQRGRDHGLATYNQTLLALGLAPASTMSDISSDPDISSRLEILYDDVDDVDLWVGALAEDRYKGMVGKLVYHGLKEQFEKLMHGDRFWYTGYLNSRERRELKKLSFIIRQNTKIGRELPINVFYKR